MAKLIPTKHLLLIGIVSVFLVIVLFVFPTKKPSTQKNISIQVTPTIIKESELNLSSQAPKPNTKLQVTPTIIEAPSKTSRPYVLDNSPSKPVEANATSAIDQPLTEPTYETHTVTVKSGDSLSKVLSQYNVSATDIHKVSQADKKHKDLLRMLPGQQLLFSINKQDSSLNTLTLQQNRLQSVSFTRKNNSFERTEKQRTPDISHTYKEATINNSLFVDGLNAGVDEPLLIELANIFGWDIDFALDIRKGDQFSLLYEEKFLDGEKIGNGNIIAAQFINNGRTYQAIRYKTSRGTHYYTPDGLAMRKAFIRTPVDFTRISSKFDPNRLHPIFKTSRPHRGVDYAAASGTPVKAAGDGKVAFAGKQNGYGNVVIINHGHGYQTLYAHLRGFARGIHRGKTVKQGKIIAFVGQTGWATGPHLHYEFRINGVHKNPVTVKLPNDDPMPKKDLKKYLPYAQEVVATLNNSNSADFSRRLALLRE